MITLKILMALFCWLILSAIFQGWLRGLLVLVGMGLLVHGTQNGWLP